MPVEVSSSTSVATHWKKPYYAPEKYNSPDLWGMFSSARCLDNYHLESLHLMGPEPTFSHIYHVPSSQTSLGVLFVNRLTKIVVPTFTLFLLLLFLYLRTGGKKKPT